MGVSKEYYKDLSVEELIQDEFFIESINRPNPASVTFWEEFLQDYSDRRETIQAAGSLIRDLKFKTDAPEEGAKARVWNAVIGEEHEGAPVIHLGGTKSRWKWAAAIAAGIVLISMAWWFSREAQVNTTIRTQYAELKQIILPDSSVVTLNTNSSLKYSQDGWKEGRPREVWLEGEAFFDVKHLHRDGRPMKESDRFIVHAGEMNIEVLGTSFNVIDRSSIARVVLQTGRVRVDFKNAATNSVDMEPGELVKFNRESKQVTKEKTDTSSQLLWKQRKIMLDNTTIRELVSTLENNFGYQIEVDQPELLDRQLSGTGIISLEDEETLFKALEVILNVEITRTNNTLLIKNK